MATRTFKMQGLSALQADLNKLPHQLQESALENASAAGARVIRDEAKRLVPVDTGQLRDSIVVSRTYKQGGRRINLRGAVVLGIKGVGRFYAHLVEFGFSKGGPRPFMRPALANKAEEALRAIAARLKPEMERAIARLPRWRLMKARRDVNAARRSLARRTQG